MDKDKQKEEFDKWLPSVCFQHPTSQAYGLALMAWREAQRIAYICTCSHDAYDDILNPGHCMNCRKPFKTGDDYEEKIYC